MTQSERVISIYAELLSNIRQVSVGVTLPSPSDATTTAQVIDAGHRLDVHHQGKSATLNLPAPVANMIALDVPKQASVQLNWRLPLSFSSLKERQPSLESEQLPWNSRDLAVGSPVCCRTCGSILVQRGIIRHWKDLPSENWAEMMEFWHCHKPHQPAEQNSDSLADRGYGANNIITAQPAVGFVDIATFMFSESDIHGLLVSGFALWHASPTPFFSLAYPSITLGEREDGRVGVDSPHNDVAVDTIPQEKIKRCFRLFPSVVSSLPSMKPLLRKMVLLGKWLRRRSLLSSKSPEPWR